MVRKLRCAVVAAALCCTAAHGADNSPGANEGAAAYVACAKAYNAGDLDTALERCNAAIAVDPQLADAYFVKGSVLMSRATIAANGHAVYVPGTREALQKYLDLAPNGPHAADAREMLRYIGTGK